jgi:anti-sigma regulatory factor (Ser/Thr protein kinase)
MPIVVDNHCSIVINHRSSIGEARRISLVMAERVKLKEDARGRVALIATELATNILLHAQDGEILFRILPVEWGPGLEIIALDHGPGISDLERCMSDGYSTRGTRGCGLGAIQRLSSDFNIYSSQPHGTVVLSRVRTEQKSPAGLEFSALSVPAPGETECGDAWHLRKIDGHLWTMVVDGLGHGPLAAAAAAEAVRLFCNNSLKTPLGYFEAAHLGLQSSRGAALAVAEIDFSSHELHYAGVGNIVSSIVAPTGGSRSLISHNGIVGVQVRKLQQFDYKWHEGDLLVMHSDGMSGRWKLDRYPGIVLADTGLIAALLYRDGKRGRDDTTVLVVRLQQP